MAAFTYHIQIELTIRKMRNTLSKRISLSDIQDICALVQDKKDRSAREELYALTLSEDERTAANALWCLTHLSDDEWLYAKHDDLIDRALAETNITKLRLMLTLLLRQPFDAESLRADFIDFCMGKITACSYPYAIRALCIKLAFEQMKHHSELLAELMAALELQEQESLSPGLASAKRQVMKRMRKMIS